MDIIDNNVHFKLSVQCIAKKDFGQNIHVSTRFFVDRYLEEFNRHKIIIFLK